MIRPTIVLRNQVKVRLPLVPNFLIVEGSDHSIPVRAFSDRDLRALGKAWTEALLERARKQVEEAAKA